jgi:hypothetical protein
MSGQKWGLEWGQLLVFMTFFIICFLILILLERLFFPYVSVVVFLFIAAAGWGLNWILIRPAAWALDRPDLGRFVRTASVLLLLLGFHFDLLAS